jgi:hypothetical protein
MLLIVAAVAALLYLNINLSIEDKNYHPICSSDLPTTCIKRESFIQQRGDPSGPSFGTANDGWDTDTIGARPNLIARQFKYGVIEYQSKNKPGKRWQADQRNAVIEEIEKSKNPLYVVIFVHGWHHNAREEIGIEHLVNQDRNLLYFKHILAKRKAELVAANKNNYEILGVYIGWQGESISNDLFFTIGSRSRAADHIGNGQDFSDDLIEIANKVQETNPENRLLVIGHSLGGRILSRFMLNQISDNTKPQQERWAPLNKNSLVVTINPAIGADAFDELMKTDPDDANPLPTWINITSKDDEATGSIFSAAASLGRLVGIGVGVTDHFFRRSSYQAIGHYRPYQTHRLGITHLGDDEKHKISTIKTENIVDYCCLEPGCTPKASGGDACQISLMKMRQKRLAQYGLA